MANCQDRQISSEQYFEYEIRGFSNYYTCDTYYSVYQNGEEFSVMRFISTKAARNILDVHRRYLAEQALTTVLKEVRFIQILNKKQDAA